MKNETGKDYEVKDYQAMRKAICEDVTNALWNEAPEKICKDFKYEGMWSPQYYNYETDRIKIKMKLDKEALHKFICDNKNEFMYYINKYWNTRDGFISFIPQSFEEWECDFKEGDKYDKPRAINIAIDYMLLTEISGEKHLDEDTMYDIDETRYYDALHEAASNRLSEYMEEK